MAFNLPDLPYAYDALQPNIDARTMEIHHGKHHAGYTAKLNAALEGVDLKGRNIEDILKNIGEYSGAVRNNGGGYYNHSLFWKVMSPNGGGTPTGDLGDAINGSFDSFDNFKEKFMNAANSQFGSGWAWLCVKEGGLQVCGSANQDNPLMPGVGCGGHPILGLDVWEHAYYLNYQNRRPDYTANFFNIINWEQVAANFKAKQAMNVG